MVSRAERSLVNEWWWTIDRWLLFSFFALMLLGILFGLAASPPVANRLGLSTFHFVNRQALFLVLAAAVMVGVSFLDLRHIRRLALVVFVVALGLVIATLIFGAEVKGARRWISLAGISIQPSEFLKPAFVMLAAWAFSENAGRQDMPGTMIGFALLPMVVVPLILQPDFGQTMLVSAVWCGLFFLAGLHLLWVVGLGGAGAVGLLLAYKFLPHVTSRVDKFLNKGSGGQGEFQAEMARESMLSGGLFGKGPGEGTVKRVLPDSHTDYIFAVIGEEFGLIVCLVVVALFALIVLRALTIAFRNQEPFARFAAAGLAMLFGLQASINIAVNLDLIPPKGMTLPFISYGGSSLVSLALTTGFLLAVTRRRPTASVIHRVPPGLAAVPA
ncbi:MAG TPA: putative lipid II flippase FtsW [Beijerinckiaceae bacterium]|nr:putative lipid II flippase FtsW [Beijerinckiaceae bacterium]